MTSVEKHANGGDHAVTQKVPAPGLSVRPMQADDLEGAVKLTRALHWPHRPEDWELHFRLGRGWVVCSGPGELAGIILWWPCGAAFGTVGLVVVAESHQGKGIGRRLMDRVMEEAGARALQLIATRAGIKLYQQCGFREIGTISQHQGTLVCAEAVAPPAGIVQRPVVPGDLAALLDLDAAAFGGDRRTLYEALLDVGGGVVAERDGNACGFALQRPFGRGTLIGPVVADDEALAISLVSHLLCASQGFTRLDIPADAAGLASWLASAGLACVDQGAIMVRGEVPMVRAESRFRVFGIASQGFN